MRFSLKDILWLIVVVGLVLALWKSRYENQALTQRPWFGTWVKEYEHQDGTREVVLCSVIKGDPKQRFPQNWFLQYRVDDRAWTNIEPIATHGGNVLIRFKPTKGPNELPWYELDMFTPQTPTPFFTRSLVGYCGTATSGCFGPLTSEQDEAIPLVVRFEDVPNTQHRMEFRLKEY